MCHNRKRWERDLLRVQGVLCLLLGAFSSVGVLGAISGYKTTPTQYHIQTDEGSERFFRFQTFNGQYRKERRLEDGTVVGSYGWVDPTGFLRMTDYIADSKGYRVLKNSMHWVGTNSIQQEDEKTKSKYVKPSQTYTPKKIGKKVILKEKVPFKVVKKRVIVTPAPKLSVSAAPVKDDQNPPVLIVYGPLRSANVRNGKLVAVRRRRPVQQAEEVPENEDDVFRKYTAPLQRNNGKASSFIYRIPNQYHKEETDRNGSRGGSYGYIDPFGIRRVIHYATNSTGFQAARDFKFVGKQQQY